jgi:hypothetical protein
MKLSGPIVTLAAGAATAAALLTMSTIAARTPTPVTPVAASSPTVQADDDSEDDTGPTPPAIDGPSGSATGTASATTPPATTPPSAPASAAPQALRTYAGRITGGTLAIAIRGDQAVAYFCDGKRLENWLSGTALGQELSLAGGKARLTAQSGNGTVTGTLIIGGRTFRVAIPAVQAPSGLYRAAAAVRGARVSAGWIVLPDGSQVGVLEGGPQGPAPAPPLNEQRQANVGGQVLTAAPADPQV